MDLFRTSSSEFFIDNGVSDDDDEEEEEEEEEEEDESEDVVITRRISFFVRLVNALLVLRIPKEGCSLRFLSFAYRRCHAWDWTKEALICVYIYISSLPSRIAKKPNEREREAKQRHHKE